MRSFARPNTGTNILNQIKQKRSGNAFVFLNQLVMTEIKTVNLERFEKKIQEIDQHLKELKSAVDKKENELRVLFNSIEILGTVREKAMECIEYGKDYRDEKD